MGLLADKTALYSKMLSMGFAQNEFKECHEALLEIQVEIEAKKKEQGTSTTLSSPDIFFEKSE
jgi:hypothetical protein